MSCLNFKSEINDISFINSTESNFNDNLIISLVNGDIFSHSNDTKFIINLPSITSHITVEDKLITSHNNSNSHEIKVTDLTKNTVVNSFLDLIETSCLHPITQNTFICGSITGESKLYDVRTNLKASLDITNVDHTDYISAYEYLNEKNQVVCTSGDGSISIIDLRKLKTIETKLMDIELLSVSYVSKKYVVGIF